MSFETTSNPEYSTFIALSKYARWIPEKGRRENWEETVARYIEFFENRFPEVDEMHWNDLFEAIRDLEVMPSMRALMTAGKALSRDNVAGFNCSYLELSGSGKDIDVLTPEMIEAGITDPVTMKLRQPKAFDELMYILMCGTGVGFSCERQFINDLPVVGHKTPRKTYMPLDENYPRVDLSEISTLDGNTITVHDSKYGWASSLRILIIELFNGNFNIKWDTSLVRPAGTPLKTFGGRASGPEPLESLFIYCVEVFKEAMGRKLTSIECHGLACKVAEIVVVGGVRRSALISLSNLSDDRMRHAKSGNWYDYNVHYALSNNSVCYTEKPDSESWIREWLALIQSKSGERGVFSRVASKNIVAKNGRRKVNYEFGTNPCSEIILRPNEFCNLSEVVARAEDTLDDLINKVKLATRLGTLQSSLTEFKYLNKEWEENTKEEALLGVSITGIMDHPVLNGSQGMQNLRAVLLELKDVAISENRIWSKMIGVNQSVAITCVKPSGTVSQLVDSASGIHPRYSEYYIRTVRADSKDPLAKMMLDKGFPAALDVMNPTSTLVFSFPIKAPEGAVFRDDRTALEQLELWLVYQRSWCEHKPSITVYVKEDEWLEVGAWVYKHFDEMSGVSFLPHSDHSYRQAPYKEITEEEYNDWVMIMPEGIDWSEIGNYETEDNTTGSQTMACSAGSCEVVDLT